jgi:class 3 adenylate cyclase
VLERKLTAILCADVYGYSRLMGEDEEATIRNLSAHRGTIDRLIEQHAAFVPTCTRRDLSKYRFSEIEGNRSVGSAASALSGPFPSLYLAHKVPYVLEPSFGQKTRSLSRSKGGDSSQ